MTISDSILVLLGLGVVLAMVHAARYYWQELKDAPRPFWLILLFCLLGVLTSMVFVDALFMHCAQTLPVYAGRIHVCSHSGALLQHYTGGHSHPENIWLWVACLGLVAPLGLSWLKHKDSQKQIEITVIKQGLTP